LTKRLQAIHKTSAFTLVEVVLALGITAFALASILVLLSIGVGSSKGSTDDTVLATMANEVINDLRRQYFFTNGVHPGPSPPVLTSGVLPGTTDVQPGLTPAPAGPYSIFFDVSGLRLQSNGSDSALSAAAVYQCLVTLQGDPATLSAVGSDGSTSTQAVNLLNVTLRFTWPAQAANPANTRTIHATIARY
jgi:type II secretory pathway pseudopilin PulG